MTDEIDDIPKGFEMSTKMIERYGKLNYFCAMESHGDIKKLRYIFCLGLGVSFRKAGEYVQALQQWGVISLSNGNWTYNSNNSFKDYLNKFK